MGKRKITEQEKTRVPLKIVLSMKWKPDLSHYCSRRGAHTCRLWQRKAVLLHFVHWEFKKTQHSWIDIFSGMGTKCHKESNLTSLSIVYQFQGEKPTSIKTPGHCWCPQWCHLMLTDKYVAVLCGYQNLHIRILARPRWAHSLCEWDSMIKR